MKEQTIKDQYNHLSSEFQALRADLTRALDAASEARAEVVRRTETLHLAVRLKLKAQEENDVLRAELRAAVDALRSLVGCLPGTVYVYGACGEMWTNMEPDSEFVNYETIEIAAIVAAYDAKHQSKAPTPQLEEMAKQMDPILRECGFEVGEFRSTECRRCGGTGLICPSGPSDAPMEACSACHPEGK